MTPVNSVFSIWEGMHEANGAGYRQGARLLAWASQPTPAPQCGVVDSSSCGAADGATRITPCTKTKPMSCSTNPGMQHACTTHDPHAPKPHTTTAQAGREDKAERIQAGHWPASDRMGKRHLPHGPRGADGPAVCVRPLPGRLPTLGGGGIRPDMHCVRRGVEEHPRRNNTGVKGQAVGIPLDLV